MGFNPEKNCFANCYAMKKHFKSNIDSTSSELIYNDITDCISYTCTCVFDNNDKQILILQQCGIHNYIFYYISLAAIIFLVCLLLYTIYDNVHDNNNINHPPDGKVNSTCPRHENASITKFYERGSDDDVEMAFILTPYNACIIRNSTSE